MGAITKVEAINFMLLHAGENTVEDLTTDVGVDLSHTTDLLDRETMDIQLRGLANNVFYDELQPDLSGIIYVPTNTLSAELITDQFSRTTDYLVTTLRGFPTPYLYNIRDRTNVWDTGTYLVEIVEKLEWEDLHTEVQRWAMAEAARKYQSMTQGDPAVDEYLREEANIWRARARADDVNAKRRNLLYQGDANLRRAILRQQSLRNPRFWGNT